MKTMPMDEHVEIIEHTIEQRNILRNTLFKTFLLLEEHRPEWYLQKHRDLINEGLACY